MSKSIQKSRRQFLTNGAFALASIPFLGAILGSSSTALAAKKAEPKKDAPLPAGQTAVPETDAVASAIGYKADVTRVDYAKYPQRKTPAAKNQFCKNCALYTSVNDGWGKCQMLTSGLVSANGWCGSWNKKA